MKTIEKLFEYGYDQLPIENFPERHEELIRIFMDLLDISRHQVSEYKDHVLSQHLLQRFLDIIDQRRNGRPLAYILGYTYFYQDRFPVSEQTLIPRYDTEHLVEAVRCFFNSESSFSLLDIGTGTGAIALSLYRLFPHARIEAIDIVEEPFKNSCRMLNIDSDRIGFKKIDFLDNRVWYGEWDCIVSNPPYLDDHDMQILDSHVKDFEPHSALYAGSDGMIFYQAISQFAFLHLKTGGFIFLEIDHKYQNVLDLFSHKIFEFKELRRDFSNLPRVVVLKKR